MKKFIFKDDSVYMGVSTRDTVESIWKKNFLHESSKFISATYLQPEDLGREFIDEKGDNWKILGQTEGREIPCENLTTKEIFTWDRWLISEILYPGKHKSEFKKTEFVKPTKKRAKKVSKEA